MLLSVALVLGSWAVVLKPESPRCGEGKEAVRVRVVDVAGRPVAGASVVLSLALPSKDYRAEALGEVAETDALGVVRWKKLPFDVAKGAIRVEVSADLMSPTVVATEARALCLLVVLTEIPDK